MGIEVYGVYGYKGIEGLRNKYFVLSFNLHTLYLYTLYSIPKNQL